MPRTRSSSNSPRPPAAAANFRLDWGGPAGSEGFLRIEIGPLSPAGGGEILLTRAIDGSRALTDWLAPPRGRKPAARDLTLTLLDAAGRPVARYAFLAARPLRLQLSPFDACESAVATESLAVGFAAFRLLD